MKIKLLPKDDLYEADCLQQSVLNPKKKKRYRSFAYIKKQYFRNPRLFIGAYNHNQLVGIIFGYVKRDTVLLREFVVEKTYRRKGIGKKMLTLFEIQAKAIYKKEILLGSEEDAEGFYLNRGYFPLLFVQIRHKGVPKNYKHKGYNIIKETNYKDAKRLYIKINKYSQKLKEKAKKDFSSYNTIYLFKKELRKK